MQKWLRRMILVYRAREAFPPARTRGCNTTDKSAAPKAGPGRPTSYSTSPKKLALRHTAKHLQNRALSNFFDHVHSGSFTSFPPSRRVRFAPKADANIRVCECRLAPASQRLAGRHRCGRTGCGDARPVRMLPSVIGGPGGGLPSRDNTREQTGGLSMTGCRAGARCRLWTRGLTMEFFELLRFP